MRSLFTVALFLLLSLVGLAAARAPVANAPSYPEAQGEKSVIVTFPDGTLDDVINRAKEDIINAGGIITHEYNLIKAFSAKGPTAAVDSISAWTAQFQAKVEIDQVITIPVGGPQ